MIDSFSRFTKGVVVKIKTGMEIIKGILNELFYCVGPPKTRMFSDNGGEFINHEIEKFTRLSGIKLATGAPYAPWLNRTKQRNHTSCDRILKRLINESPNKNLQSLVNQAAWVHNSNLPQNGGVPITLMTGNKPRFTLLNKGDDKNEDNNEIEDQIDKLRNIQKCYLESELERLINNCGNTKVPAYKHDILKPGVRVMVQFDEKKRSYDWECPFIVTEIPNIEHKVNVETDEGTIQIPRPRVSRYYNWYEKDNDENDDIKLLTDLSTGKVVTIPRLDNKMTGLGLWDAYDTGIGKNIYETYVIELGIADMENPEVQAAMNKDLENMAHYQVFGEKVKIEPGMNIVGTRFVNTKKEAQGGQKQK